MAVFVAAVAIVKIKKNIAGARDASALRLKPLLLLPMAVVDRWQCQWLVLMSCKLLVPLDDGGVAVNAFLGTYC